jgi:hypothetical protein
MNRSALFTLGLLAAGALLSPTAASAQTCTSLEALVDRALPPEVGDAATMGQLLSVTASSHLTRSFHPSQAQYAVGDSLVADSTCPPYNPTSSTGVPFQCVYRNSTGAKLKVNLGEGKAVYLNRNRSAATTPITLSEEKALSLATEAARAYGVPMDELSTSEADVRGLRLTTKDGATGRASSYRAELHVRFARRVAGRPLPDSGFHAAINAQGQIARLHLRWPDFRIEPGLSATHTLPRAVVRDRLVAAIAQDNSCGSVADVKATVAYISVRDLELGGLGDDESSQTTLHASVDTYVPALMVTVVPVEQAEDSGIVQLAGEDLAVPLLERSAQ